MKITVLMSSGDEDDWNDVADAVDDRGALVVLAEIEGEQIPGGLKTMQIKTELPDGEKTQTFQVMAVYAPGMWMKAEYDA